MLHKFLRLTCLFLLGLGACRKTPSPSEEYARALKLHSSLYAEQFDEAYLDPRMREVESLLEQVHIEQREYSAAQGMLAKIKDGRDRAGAEQSKRAAAMEAVMKEPPFQHSASAPRTSEKTSPVPVKPSATAQEDSPSNQPESGMASNEFLSRFGACFSRWQSIEVRGQGPMDAYELKDIANCRERHAHFVKRLVLLGPDSVYSFVDKSAVRTELRLPDGGRLLDGGPGETRK